MSSKESINFGLPIPGEAAATSAGSSQVNAYVLSKQVTVFETVPFGTGCVLPSSYSANAAVNILNRSGNALLIYPAGGDNIDGLATNTPVSLDAGGNVTMVCFDPPLSGPPKTWFAIMASGGLGIGAGGGGNGGGIGTQPLGVIPPRIVTVPGMVSIMPDDGLVVINKTVDEPTMVIMEAAPTAGMTHIIKDGKGNASGYPITIDGNGRLIDGHELLILNDDRSAVTLQAGDSGWYVTGIMVYSSSGSTISITGLPPAQGPLVSGTLFGTSDGTTDHTATVAQVQTLLGVGSGGGSVAPRVVTAAGPVTVIAGDDLVVINKTTGAPTTVTLEASPSATAKHKIKDGKGDAGNGTNTITVSGNGHLIDGASTFLIDRNYAGATFEWNGSQWSVT